MDFAYDLYLFLAASLPPGSAVTLAVLTFAFMHITKSEIRNERRARIILLCLILYGIIGSVVEYMMLSEVFSLSEYVEVFIISLFSIQLIGIVVAYAIGYLLFKKGLIIQSTIVLWLFYAVYEFFLMPTYLCPDSCNIRIDLVLIWPILLIFTIITTVKSIEYLRNVLPRMTSNPRSTRVLLIVTAAAFLAVGFIFGYYVREIHDYYNFIYNEKTPQEDVNDA